MYSKYLPGEYPYSSPEESLQETYWGNKVVNLVCSPVIQAKIIRAGRVSSCGNNSWHFCRGEHFGCFGFDDAYSPRYVMLGASGFASFISLDVVKL